MAEPFILNEELTAFQDQAILLDEEFNMLSNNNTNWDNWFNELSDNFEENPNNIIQLHLFNRLKYCLTIFNDLPENIACKLSDIILNAFNTFISYTEEDIEANSGPFDEQKQACDMFGFFTYSWIDLINSQLESEDLTKTKTKSKSTKSTNKKQVNSLPTLIQLRIPLMKAILRSLKLNLKKIYPTSYELESYVGMFTKLMFQLLSTTDNLKNQELCQLTYQILAYSAKHYNQNFGIQTSILQNLQYYEHFSDSMAEILGVCCNEYEHTSLAEDVLKDISNKDFVYTDKIGPKSFSRFLVKLCELNYKILMKQMHSLIKHLDSEAYQMRNGLIEIIGMLIDQLSQLDFTENLQVQIDHFFDVIEERFRDNSSLVRSKLLQVVAKIAECKAKFPKRRIKLIYQIIGRLEDKSSIVRKNSIKALSSFLITHPFSMDGGELSKGFFQKKHDQIKKRLEELQNILMEERPPHLEVSAMNINPEEAPPNDPVDLAGPEFTELSLKQKYYSDGLLFIEQICSAIPILAQLLNSTLKQETLEAMDFFVSAYQYKIEDATYGVKKMIHLVWTKDNTDEGKGVRKHLVDCIRRVYFTIPLAVDHKSTVNGIVRNLISLTYKATLADLTSLEELLIAMTEAGHIEPDVVNKLWNVYGHTKTDIPRPQRRGAIIILGMIGHAIPTMIGQNVGIMMKIGLGEFGKEDLELAKYTCIALQCIGGTRKRVKGNNNPSNSKRLPMTDPLFDQLKTMLEMDNDLVTWFSMAEQVINVIYNLGQRPDTLCEELIHLYIEKARNAQRFEEDKSLSDPWPLSQLIFIVGHVAIKHIVFLEVIEAELKKKGANKSIMEDEFDQVTGTAEDEIVEIIARIRDRELLFSPDALLSKFGPLVVDIAANNKVYTDSMLQISATLTMAKFMCVSSVYCEENLQLLLTILQKSKNHVIRSNIIIALGDIAVCSNILIGDNMSYLYRRLRDSESAVKKNSLMVLTHLILNGMIKVKGQLGEMAKCLQDEDPRISDLAKLFFTELASKDNAVYNNLPDMISHLSTGEDSVDENTFHKIMKFLFDFIKEKEKQCESVVEKLCQRFRNSDDPRNWRDIAYCLNLIPFKSEKTFKKLIEGFGFYQDKIHEEKVFGYFSDIISKARLQVWQRTEAKMIIDELDELIKKIKHGDSMIIDNEIPQPTNDNADQMEVDESPKEMMDTTD